MIRQLASILRRFGVNTRGTVAIEYALILPVLLLFSFGIMEISLCMASMVTLEGGLKEASRYGITSQSVALTPAQNAQVPTAFSGADNRTKMIMSILNQNTLDLINLNTATISTQTYTSFSAVKDGEPFTDLNSNGVRNAGEPYSDMNCNGQYDAAGSSGTGTGTSGTIVVYTVTYNWRILTPIVGQYLGKPDPLNAGKYIIPMSSSIVVKNEPNLAGSSFCS